MSTLFDVSLSLRVFSSSIMIVLNKITLISNQAWINIKERLNVKLSKQIFVDNFITIYVLCIEPHPQGSFLESKWMSSHFYKVSTSLSKFVEIEKKSSSTWFDTLRKVFLHVHFEHIFSDEHNKQLKEPLRKNLQFCRKYRLTWITKPFSFGRCLRCWNVWDGWENCLSEKCFAKKFPSQDSSHPLFTFHSSACLCNIYLLQLE